ncbi:hypothetical protein ABBQ38_002130 [Trebouxia sp. C0009 RCD-2024]
MLQDTQHHLDPASGYSCCPLYLSQWKHFKTLQCGGITDHVFVDDAILIEMYYVTDAKVGDGNTPLSTIGVSINANPRSNKGKLHHWIDFDVDWKDNEWHHLAVTWRFETGRTELFFDGVANMPTWRGSAGRWQTKAAREGGVDPNMAAGTLRLPKGSLVLGQNQECYGGCFNPQSSLKGDLADVRIWSKALMQDAIRANRFKASLEDTDGLVARYVFTADNIQEGRTDANGLRKKVVLDSTPSKLKKPLYLWSDMPRFEVSTAPLADKQGQALQLPDSPWLDHALFLSDQQVLLATNFQNFPSTAVTVEFWMWSVDNCNQGVPFSYATGPYGDGDNSFLIYGYNNWMITVMEENGVYGDRDSGTGSADGQWHHVAVTWASQDGHTHLYLDGRKAWSTVRGKGKRIPSGGTLVIGREQDCPGGCFDSHEGAAGQTQRTYQLEYGAQDFIGVMDEIRIWSTVRSQSQIQQGIASDVKRTEMNEADVDIGRIKHDDPDLVAYWTCEEGSGYLVKDVTGKGHDLHIQQPPQWRVVGPQQLCGNGLVEGLEQCDDGNTASGDGCSSTCQIKEGFQCSGLQPSTCWPAEEPAAATAAAQSDGAFEKSSRRPNHHLAIITVGVLVAVLLSAFGLVYFAGQDIAHMWPVAAPSFSNLSPSSSWVPAGLARLWGGREPGGEEYLGLPLADTEMGPDGHGSFSPAEPPATLYEPPPQETTAPLQDRSLPDGS